MIDYNKKYKDIAPKPLKIRVIWAALFILLARKRDYEIFVVTIEDIKKVLELKQYINPRLLISEEYYNIINMFKRQFTNQLPPYQDKYDFKIELEPSITPKFNLLYGISQKELLVI